MDCVSPDPLPLVTEQERVVVAISRLADHSNVAPNRALLCRSPRSCIVASSLLPPTPLLPSCCHLCSTSLSPASSIAVCSNRTLLPLPQPQGRSPLSATTVPPSEIMLPTSPSHARCLATSLALLLYRCHTAP
ncbi:hypothetical protein BHE74_00024444 [Ensete ventricosum]|nr:hypothetical protein BHE74_00024444 [Ensete ventricosum]